MIRDQPPGQLSWRPGRRNLCYAVWLAPAAPGRKETDPELFNSLPSDGLGGRLVEGVQRLCSLGEGACHDAVGLVKG